MFFDYIKLAFAEIRANKLEVFLTTMGIIVGIAAVTMILAIGEGVTKMIKNQIAVYRENVAFISYSPDKQKSDTAASAFGDISGNPLAGLMNLIKSASDAKRLEKDREWALPFDINEYTQLLEKNPYIEQASFFARMRTEIPFYDHSESGYLNFCDNHFGDYIKDDVQLGRMFSDAEIINKTPVALIKVPVDKYKNSLQWGGLVGSTIEVEDFTFKIVGVIPGTAYEVYVPYTFYKDIATLDNYPQFLVRMVKSEDVKQTTADMFKWQSDMSLNGDYFQEDSDINLFNQVLVYLPKFTALMSFIAGISLLVGGIGIMNSMLSSVIKRTKEIGIRKSIGAKNISMIFQFIIETVMISSIGGAIGIVLGVLVSTICLRLFGVPPVFPVLSIVYCSVFTLVIGIASGVVPAIKAAKLDPIDALGHT